VSATTTCPFAPMCEREFVGPDLDDAERAKLEAHLSTGCPTCEEVFELHLTGSDPAAPGNDGRRELDEALTRSLAGAAEVMAGGRDDVLRRLDERLAREEYLARARLRRRHLRVVFYMTSLVALALLGATYVGTVAAIRLKERAARSNATRTELEAMIKALSRWKQDHGAPPTDLAGLLQALDTPRKGGEGEPYYPLDPARRRDGAYLDGFDRPYVYVGRADRALIYSVGPDGKDDGGDPDDLSAPPLFFVQ
jgi:hypothetical protein